MINSSLQFSPAFRAVAEERGYYIDPLLNAQQNNRAVLQNLVSACKMIVEEHTKVIDSLVRDVTQLKSRRQFGISDD